MNQPKIKYIKHVLNHKIQPTSSDYKCGTYYDLDQEESHIKRNKLEPKEA